MSQSSIVIGVCSGGTMRVETVASLMDNMIYLAQKNDMLPGLYFQVGGYVDVNRNVIVKEAIKMGATHLMFLDNDMIFPEDGIYRLLQHDKDVVGANYNVRLDPTSAVLSGPTAKMLVNGTPMSMTSQDFPKELFKCYAVATGFMMIKTDIFKSLEEPYFEASIKEGVHHTEDVDFCRKVNEAGLEVWCDPTIKMGHVGSYVY